MGTIQIDGSTPKLTIGNATAEDALILFDGAAQDFYIGLDDSADDLIIGLGSAVGTTPAISINEDRDVTISDGAIDFDIASHDTSNGLKLGGTLVTATAAELNIMDGVTATAAEINLIDGGTARGTTSLADGDGILINDAGTMRMTNVTTVKTYMSTSLDGIDDQTSSNDDQLTITDTAVVINEDGDDVDFRIEGDDNDAVFSVDGGLNSGVGLVGIGSSPDLGVGLHIKTADSGASVAVDADELVLENSGQCGLTILAGTSSDSRINFGDSGTNDQGKVTYYHGSDHMRFDTSGSEKVRIDSSGNILIAKTSLSSGTVGMELRASGEFIVTRSGATPGDFNRLADDGNLVLLRQASSTEGIISVSGTTVSYGTFCGTHWSRLADNSKPTILRGTVLESIATMMDWYQAVADVAEVTESTGEGEKDVYVTPAHQVKESIALPDGKSVGDAVTFTSNEKEYTGVYVKEDNEQLPMCKVSDTEDSKAVYGVFMVWDDHDDGLDGDVNDMYVAALGAFVVRVHSGETVAIGDYLQSRGDGTAKVQADDILRASTIAKVTSTEKTITHADGSYCVPCTLHCG